MKWQQLFIFLCLLIIAREIQKEKINIDPERHDFREVVLE